MQNYDLDTPMGFRGSDGLEDTSRSVRVTAELPGSGFFTRGTLPVRFGSQQRTAGQRKVITFLSSWVIFAVLGRFFF